MRTTILKAIEHPGSFSPSLGLTIPTSLNTWPNTASTESSGQVASRNEVAPLDPKAKSWEEEPTAQRGSGTKSPSTTAERSARDPVLGPQTEAQVRQTFIPTSRRLLPRRSGAGAGSPCGSARFSSSVYSAPSTALCDST